MAYESSRGAKETMKNDCEWLMAKDPPKDDNDA